MKTKKRFSLWRLLPSILTVIILTLYFPVYNQPGIHTSDGFFQNTEDGVYENNMSIIREKDGLLTFSGDYHPLTVTQSEDVYTITRQDEVLFSGKAPDAAHDRLIQAGGTLVDTESPDESADYYPVSVSQVIAIVSGNLETRGNSRYLALALAILAIWCVDILFPDFFFRADFRQMGKKNAPSPTYRKVQRTLWIVLPLWGLMCLILAIFG